MIESTPILAARVIHILSSTMWAGFIIVIGLAHTRPSRGESGEEGRKFRRTVTGRAARVVPSAAFISVISGAYLFVALHESVSAQQGTALALGAIFAVLFFPVIALVGRPAELKLASLDSQRAAGASAADAREIARLNRRVLAASYAAVMLMALAAVAMASARYL